MIQYKLIKEYPGSPKLEFSHNENHSNFKGSEYYDLFPEFWEKVEELDYEIINYRDYNGNISDYQELGSAINSVKRLSDGEVFSIGDLIDFEDFGNKGNQPVERIEIDYFDNTRITAWDGPYGIGIKKWKKQSMKTPLFTTEDGVDIFEGGSFSVVQLRTFQILNECKHHLTHPLNWLCFSTEEKAKEYVLFNKPCLSLSDISTTLNKHSPLFNNIKELAKAKL